VGASFSDRLRNGTPIVIHQCIDRRDSVEVRRSIGAAETGRTDRHGDGGDGSIIGRVVTGVATVFAIQLLAAANRFGASRIVVVDRRQLVEESEFCRLVFGNVRSVDERRDEIGDLLFVERDPRHECVRVERARVDQASDDRIATPIRSDAIQTRAAKRILIRCDRIAPVMTSQAADRGEQRVTTLRVSWRQFRRCRNRQVSPPIDQVVRQIVALRVGQRESRHRARPIIGQGDIQSRVLCQPSSRRAPSRRAKVGGRRPEVGSQFDMAPRTAMLGQQHATPFQPIEFRIDLASQAVKRKRFGAEAGARPAQLKRRRRGLARSFRRLDDQLEGLPVSRRDDRPEGDDSGIGIDRRSDRLPIDGEGDGCAAGDVPTMIASAVAEPPSGEAAPQRSSVRFGKRQTSSAQVEDDRAHGRQIVDPFFEHDAGEQAVDLLLAVGR